MAESRKPMIIDMHCHILPGLDDGCRNTEMLRKMLRQASEQGVAGMVCTPHYYPDESIDSFLHRREKAILKLADEKERADFRVPAFAFGAEVAWDEILLDQPNLHTLCITDTDYMLVEMPFRPWSRRNLSDLVRLQRLYGIHPIIAHLERYLAWIDDDTIAYLLHIGARIQMNGETLLIRKTAGTAKKMLKAGTISLLGSDTHHPVHRPQTLGDAYARLHAWKLDALAEEISQNSIRVLQNRF